MESGLYVLRSRSLLFEPGKGGSWGEEDISGQARSMGGEDERLWAPCGVSTAPSASSVHSSGGWRSHISKVATSAPSSWYKLSG